MPTNFARIGWHSRGYLPHLDQSGMIQTVTFRLNDSLPSKVVAQWKAELELNPERELVLRKRIATVEDEGRGRCWLRQTQIAEVVQGALLHFDGIRYRLIAWCVMPNTYTRWSRCTRDSPSTLSCNRGSPSQRTQRIER